MIAFSAVAAASPCITHCHLTHELTRQPPRRSRAFRFFRQPVNCNPRILSATTSATPDAYLDCLFPMHADELAASRPRSWPPAHVVVSRLTSSVGERGAC